MGALETLLGEGTKGRILEELLDGGRTTRELAAMLKIRESAVRMHLERMVEMGLLTSSFHREGIGRPRKKFFLTPSGHELFARRYDLALDTLVESMIDKEGEPFVRSVFTDAGKRLAEKMSKDLPYVASGAPYEERLQAVLRLMNVLGQRAKVVKVNGKTCIESHNCIFRTSAGKHPNYFCDLMHKGMVEKVLSPTKVELPETIAKGAKNCLFVLPS